MAALMDAMRKNRELHEYTSKLKKENKGRGEYVCDGCKARHIAPCDGKGNCDFTGYVSEVYEKVFG